MWYSMSYNKVDMMQGLCVGVSRDIRDFAFFCVWTNETSASSQFGQLISHAKARQWSDDILP